MLPRHCIDQISQHSTLFFFSRIDEARGGRTSRREGGSQRSRRCSTPGIVSDVIVPEKGKRQSFGSVWPYLLGYGLGLSAHCKL